MTPLIPFQRPRSLWSASQNFKFQDCLALITEALRDSAAVSFVRFQEMLDLTNLDLPRDVLDAHHNVVDQPFVGVGSEQPEEVAGLGEIVVASPMIVAFDWIAPDVPRDVAIKRIFGGAAKTVGLIVSGSAAVLVEANVPVAMIGVNGTFGLVDRQ